MNTSSLAVGTLSAKCVQRTWRAQRADRVQLAAVPTRKRTSSRSVGLSALLDGGGCSVEQVQFSEDFPWMRVEILHASHL